MRVAILDERLAAFLPFLRVSARACALVGAGAVIGACTDPQKTGPAGGGVDAGASLSLADGATSNASGADAGPSSTDGTDATKGSPIPAVQIAGVVNPNGAPAYAGPTGSLEGTISYAGDPPADVPVHADATKCPRANEVYGKEFRIGAATPSGSELADAIVAVTGYKDFYVPEQHEGVPISIDGCAISPRTTLATFGQRLEVRNIGSELIAPAIDQGLNAALMVAVPHAKDPIFLYPRKPGRFLMVDRLNHTFMRNDLYVLPNSLHAVSDLHGHYRIDGIPVGKLTVNATHPTFTSEANRPVEIISGVVAKADLLLTHKLPDAGASGASSTPPRSPGAPR